MNKYQYISKHRNHITVVAVQVNEDEFYIGVARCGDGEKFSKELGLEIAERRALVTPFTKVKRLDQNTFDRILAPAIAENQHCMRQSNLGSYRRIRRPKKSGALVG